MAFNITESDFEKQVTECIGKIPNLYQENLSNIAFFVEDEPSQEQRKKLNLRPCESLFGLYEGVPLTERHGGYALTLPDKITVFKIAHEQNASNLKDLKIQLYNTIWHEVAHYYGLNHQRIAELEHKHE
jgi:predicted Zn-dependent protease with MMP-like domain